MENIINKEKLRGSIKETSNILSEIVLSYEKKYAEELPFITTMGMIIIDAFYGSKNDSLDVIEEKIKNDRQVESVDISRLFRRLKTWIKSLNNSEEEKKYEKVAEEIFDVVYSLMDDVKPQIGEKFENEKHYINGEDCFFNSKYINKDIYVSKVVENGKYLKDRTFKKAQVEVEEREK